MPSHLTIVYTINDQKAFRQEQQKIMDAFNATDCAKGFPFAITAISNNHEIHRLELIEAALDSDEPKALISEICSHPNIDKINSIDELE